VLEARVLAPVIIQVQAYCSCCSLPRPPGKNLAIMRFRSSPGTYSIVRKQVLPWRPNQLERHVGVDFLVDDLVGAPHAAAAQFLDDPVAADVSRDV